jgi:hypothetical protein
VKQGPTYVSEGRIKKFFIVLVNCEYSEYLLRGMPILGFAVIRTKPLGTIKVTVCSKRGWGK